MNNLLGMRLYLIDWHRLFGSVKASRWGYLFDGRSWRWLIADHSAPGEAVYIGCGFSIHTVTYKGSNLYAIVGFCGICGCLRGSERSVPVVFFWTNSPDADI